MDPRAVPPAATLPRNLIAGAREVAAATLRRITRDRLTGLAAEVSFFFLLAIPPMLITIASMAGVIAELLGNDVRRSLGTSIVTAMGGFLTPDATENVVRPFIDGLFERAGGVLSVGLVVAVWSASRMVRVLVQAMNIAFEVPSRRAAWLQRLFALGLTLAMILSFVVYLVFLIVGPTFGRSIDEWIGAGSAAQTLWGILYWPVAVVVGLGLLASLYHFAPNWRTSWRRHIPGALVAGMVWISAALGLRLYVNFSFTNTAGPLGAPLVALIWLYVSSFAVLLGAEVNAAVEQTWPTAASHPKDQPD